jgi:hypothetical protein
MLELLGEIEELLLIYPKRSGESQPHMVACFSHLEAEQQQRIKFFCRAEPGQKG